MNGKKLRSDLQWVISEFGSADMAMFAASGTYYLFFSLGPVVVIFLALMPYLPITDQDVMRFLLTYTPPQFQELVEQLVQDLYAGSTVALGVASLLELWSAGRFLSFVMRGISEIYDGRPRGSFLRRRLLAALYTLALVVLVLANTVLMFFGERIVTRLWPDGNGFWAVLIRGRMLVFIAAITLAIALIFCHIPQQKRPFRNQLPGALISSLAWLCFSQLYSWAVDRFSMYSIYGGLAIVIVSLFWVYCSLYILFCGAWINTLPDRWHRRALDFSGQK